MIVGLLVRVIPVVRGQRLGVDTYYHLLAARTIKEIHGLPKSLDSFVVHGRYAYPPAFHFILSCVVDRLGERLLASLSALIDIVHATLVLGFALWLPRQVSELVVLTAYLLTPICVIESLSLTPRSLGSMWISCTMFTFSMALSSGSIPLIIAASSFYALTLLTHRMASQALFLVLVVEAVVLGIFFGYTCTVFAMVIVIFGTFLALVVSKGHYIRILREHVGYLRFHHYHGSLLGGEKRFGNLSTIVRKNNPWVVLASLVPMVGLLRQIFPSSILASDSPGGQQVLVLLTVWMFSSTVIAFLWRYGEGERHVLYSAAPSALLVGLAYGYSYFTIVMYWLILAYCGVRIAAHLQRFSRPFLVEDTLVACFRDLFGSPSKTVMTIPSAYAYAAAYYTGQKIAGCDASFKCLEYGSRVLRNALQDYKSFKVVLKELNATHLVVEAENSLVSNLVHDGLVKKRCSCGDFTVYSLSHQMGA